MNLSQTRKEKRKTQKRVKASQSAGNEENGVLKSTCEKLLNSMNSKKKKKDNEADKKKNNKNNKADYTNAEDQSVRYEAEMRSASASVKGAKMKEE